MFVYLSSDPDQKSGLLGNIYIQRSFDLDTAINGTISRHFNNRRHSD